MLFRSSLKVMLPLGVPEPGELASVILITHKTNEQAIRDALAAIEADGKIADKPQVIRIEEL